MKVVVLPFRWKKFNIYFTTKVQFVFYQKSKKIKKPLRKSFNFLSPKKKKVRGGGLIVFHGSYNFWVLWKKNFVSSMEKGVIGKQDLLICYYKIFALVFSKRWDSCLHKKNYTGLLLNNALFPLWKNAALKLTFLRSLKEHLVFNGKYLLVFLK